MTAPDFDQIREGVLDRMERHARHVRTAVLTAAILESLMLISAILVIDWSDRTHLLVMILAVLGYTIVLLGLLALGAHVSKTIGQLASALLQAKR
jgi:hypothetical protein